MNIRFSITILFKNDKVDDILFLFSENLSVPDILYSEVLHAALVYKDSKPSGFIFFKNFTPIEKYLSNDYSEWGKKAFKYKLNKKDFDYIEAIIDYLPVTLFNIKYIKDCMIYSEIIDRLSDYKLDILKFYEKLVKAFIEKVFGELNHVSEIPYLVLEKIGILGDDQLNFMKRENRRDITLEKIIIKLFE